MGRQLVWELDGDITGVKEASGMKRFHRLSDGDSEMCPECYRCADHLGSIMKQIDTWKAGKYQMVTEDTE